MGFSNNDSPRGLRPISNASGVLTPGIEYAHIPKTNTVDLYEGMLVKLTGTGGGGLPVFSGDQPAGANRPDPYHSNEGEYPDIAFHAPADVADVWGVIVGFEYDGDLAKNGTKYLPALTEGLARVCTDRNAEFECALDTPLTAAAIGLNVDMTAVAAIPAFGNSGQKLAAATAAVTATHPLRLTRIKNAVGNDATANDAVWIVRLNTSSKDTRLGIT